MSPVPPEYAEFIARLELKTLDAIERATFCAPDSLRLVVDIVPIRSATGEIVAAGVNCRTEANTADVPDAVGAAWIGICRAINHHMRDRGAHDFDCLKRYEVKR